MHGQNRVRGREDRPDGWLQVHKIFYTLQGEGPYTGMPAVFVRLTGCNLRCWFCDTTWNDDKDLYKSPLQVAQAIYQLIDNAPACKLIVITGGEPLRQDLAPFFKVLYETNWDGTVQIETAGTLWQDCLHNSLLDVQIVVSPKTPKIHPLIYTHAAAFKYVIRMGDTATDDGLPYATTQNGPEPHNRLARPRALAPVYLSPCDENDPFKNDNNTHEVARLALKHGYRAGVQLHKVLGLP